MKFKIIACVNEKLTLGNEGNLIYHIGNDMKNFKRMTTNNVVIMGRKTFESLPNQEPLPNRVNIIVTSNKEYCIDSNYENVFIVHSIEDAINLCDAFYSDKDCFVIGGATLYQQFIEKDLVDTLYLTEVNDDADGDTYFPNVLDNWYLFYQSYTQRQRSNELTYKFSIYKK